MRQEGYTADKLEQLLNKASGLKGISGVSEDMRRLRRCSQKATHAKLALDIFVHRLRSSIGAMPVWGD